MAKVTSLLNDKSVVGNPYPTTPYKVPEVGLEPNLDSSTTADSDCVCAFFPQCCAANALQEGVSNCRRLASIDTDLQRVVRVWDELPEQIRRAILALVGSS